jgi:hypothetical protein
LRETLRPRKTARAGLASIGSITVNVDLSAVLPPFILSMSWAGWFDQYDQAEWNNDYSILETDHNKVRVILFSSSTFQTGNPAFSICQPGNSIDISTANAVWSLRKTHVPTTLLRDAELQRAGLEIGDIHRFHPLMD